jgi:glucuronate isomerase
MASYITDDFLLQTDEARRLYHDYAAELPIIDYHCHLPPDQVAKDHQFRSLTELWLGGDHYKWRAMRTAGVDERFCTGEASDEDKFEKWAEVMPALLRNPLHHWTHLEMARYFGIDDRLLGPDTARAIWDEVNPRIPTEEFSARALVSRSNVVAICTTDDPVDSLEHHATVAADDSFTTKMLPAWRPDKAMAVENTTAFNEYVDKLEGVLHERVRSLADYMDGLRSRHAYFHDQGCRVSDHGLDVPYAEDFTEAEVEGIFRKVRGGAVLEPGEVAVFKSFMLYEFGVMDYKKGWVQQYHLLALRNNNTRMFDRLGPDTGFDSMDDRPIAGPLSKMLDRLDAHDRLTKTILYTLNPTYNPVMATMLGNFQDGRTPGKIQFGSGWWFNDQKDGMERQMETLSQMGLISQFVGMLTDSRSFLSYTRHEYFRRILCNMFGSDMAHGLVPNDFDLVGRIIRDICFNNAANYFEFGIEPADK